MRQCVKAFVTILFVMMPWLGQAATVDLTTIRLVKKETGVRLIFELSQATPSHLAILHHPERVQVEFDDTHLVEKVNALSLAVTPIKKIETAITPSGGLRLTFETTSLSQYRLLPNTASEQYVLDMNGTDHSVESQQVVPPIKVLPVAKTESVTVVIDAGHGGKDTGAVGINGTREKDVVLGLAKKLADIINRQPHMHAVLTRKGDYFVPLRDRLRLARKGNADVFVAIHADSYFNTQAGGVSVYALSRKGATSEAARWIAKRENTSELGGVDLGELQDQSYVLRSVLIDLAQTATITDSLHLGFSILNALGAVTELHYKQIEQAPFVVLKSPDIPSVLVETGFISNPKEEARLRSPEYQQQIAQAVFIGIQHYIKKYDAG